jgi:hypothetical protein
MRRRLSHWILAALLVFGQAALLAHQADVDAHLDHGTCSTCLLVHGLDNAIPIPFVLHVDVVDAPVFVAGHADTGTGFSVAYCQARAPPLCTHPN